MYYLKILLFFLTGIHYALLTDEVETTTAAPEGSVSKKPDEIKEYVAGVVECNTVSTGKAVFKSNFDSYKSLITKAADKKCNILVFPEASLAGSNGLRRIEQPEKCESSGEGENSTDITPNKAMQALICLAKEKKMYLVFESVADDCTTPKKCLKKDTFFVYNQNGTVNSKFFKAGPKIITTDFGKFMIVSEKDLYQRAVTKLLFEQKITNVISTVTNQNNPPLFTAVAMQAGWAYAYNINLFASGFGYGSKPDVFGSGIYMGKKGPIVTSMTTKEDPCKVVTAVVKENPDPWVSENIIPVPRTNNIDLKSFVQEKINATTDTISDKKLCHKGFCCNFAITFTKSARRKIREDGDEQGTSSTVTPGSEKSPGADGDKGVHYRS